MVGGPLSRGISVEVVCKCTLSAAEWREKAVEMLRGRGVLGGWAEERR